MTVDGKRWKEMAVKAAAELAIVVVGVTLALWADDWVSERESRSLEQARLRALADNVDQTLIEIRRDLDAAVDAADALRRLITEEHLPPEEQIDLVRYGLLYGPEFSPELNVYDDLKNSGELALLTNPELRRWLARLDSSLELLELAQADFTGMQHLQIDSFAVDHIDLPAIYSNYFGLDLQAADESALLEVIRNPRFRNRMMLKLDLTTYVDGRFRDTEEVLINVQSLIKIQLDES